MYVNLVDACLLDYTPCVHVRHVSENLARLVVDPVFEISFYRKRCDFHFALPFYEIVQEKTTAKLNILLTGSRLP